MLTLALLAFIAFIKFQGKAATFFVKLFQGHFILQRRPCLGTPNFMSCQLIYQEGKVLLSKKKADIFLD